MRCHKSRQNRDAFTLVELLVVIGIITVLVAILMPALARARDHAYRAKCAANLHTLGQALMGYTQQYRYYPGYGAQEITTSLADAAVWPARLRAFVGGGNKEVFHCPSQEDRCRWSDGGPLPLTRAQAGSRFVRLGYEPGEPLINSRTYFSYGYNGWGATHSEGSVAQGTHRALGFYLSPSFPRDQCELPSSRVRVPPDMVAITDSTADGNHDAAVRPLKGSGKHLWPGNVHGGGANVLFCDGHVQWYPQEDLLVDLVTDRAAAAFKIRRWNNDHGLGN